MITLLSLSSYDSLAELVAEERGSAVPQVLPVFAVDDGKVTVMFRGDAGYDSGLPAAAGARHRAVLASVGLPTSYRQDRWEHLAAAMRRDKKARGAMLRFVVLEGIGRPVRLEGPDDEHLRAAYAALAPR